MNQITNIGQKRRIIYRLEVVERLDAVLGGKTYEGMGGKATTTHTGLDITSVGLMLDDETLVISVQNTLSEMGEAETDSIATLAVIQKTFRLSK